MAVNNNVAAAAAGDAGRHSDVYKLMQMLVEANSISQQLNRHTVCLPPIDVTSFSQNYCLFYSRLTLD